MSNKMQAVIMAGGKGARLKPYTTVLPKPLMPVDDIPILEIILKRLAEFGFKEVIISLGYLQELIEAYFRNGEKWKIKISYIREDEPLSTIAPLKLIRNLEGDFLVMNGDVLTDLNYNRLIQYHKSHKASATIASYNKKVKMELGVMEVDYEKIVGFKEKPQHEYIVSMGIYIFNEKILKYIPDNKPFGFDKLMSRLIEAEESVYSYLHTGKWFDLGNHEDYAQAQEEFIHNKRKFLNE